MGLIAIAICFDQYDMALLSMALKQIQADLGIGEAELGSIGAFVRLGALPSFLIVMAADLVGRRRIMILTIVGYTLLTGLTALAPDTRSFMLLQFFARTFAIAEVILAYVVISEEFDAAHRGWGVGALAALGACGHGLALLLFSLVDVVPFGWRSLYLVGLVPLIWVAWMRRTLPETSRFEAVSTERLDTWWRNAMKPGIGLIRDYPARFVAISAVIFLLSFAEYSGGFFGPKYLQEAHGWQPWQYSVLGFSGGFLAIFGSAWAGRVSDRRGRRITAVIFLLLHPLLVVAFYQGSGVWLAPFWVLMVFTGIGSAVVLATYGNELFPTSYRSTASGARSVVATLGGVLGLATESILYGVFGSHWTAISILVLLAFLAPVIVYFVFPETSGRHLEEISPESGT